MFKGNDKRLSWKRIKIICEDSYPRRYRREESKTSPNDSGNRNSQQTREKVETPSKCDSRFKWKCHLLSSIPNQVRTHFAIIYSRVWWQYDTISSLQSRQPTSRDFQSSEARRILNCKLGKLSWRNHRIAQYQGTTRLIVLLMFVSKIKLW